MMKYEAPDQTLDFTQINETQNTSVLQSFNVTVRSRYGSAINYPREVIAMALKRVKRKGHQPTKYCFNISLKELVIYGKKKPENVQIAVMHRHRRYACESRPLERSFSNANKYMIIWPDFAADMIKFTTTFFKNPSNKQFDNKEWTIIVEEITKKGKTRPLAAVQLNFAFFVNQNPNLKTELKLKLRSLQKDVNNCMLSLIVSSTSVNEGHEMAIKFVIMGLLFYIFRVLILLICIIHFQECIDIFEVRNNIYVRHDQRIVNVLKRDHIKSQIFEFDATSFHAKSPQGIGNISSEIIKQHAETFSVTATAQINHNIDYLFKQTCSTNQEQNRHIPDVKTNFNKKGEYLNQYSKKISERTKRMIPIPLGVVVIGGAAFLFYGIIMAVKYEVKLDSLQQQLKESQKDLNVVTMALNNLTKDFLESKYLTNFKFEYNSYLSRYQETVHEFVKILHSGKAVTIESIPEELAKYFPVNDNDHEQKFYYLRLIGCNGTRMFIELTVADSRIIDSLKCHSFSHAGYFKEKTYTQYELPFLYCYVNGSCSTVDQKQCLSYFSSLNCTEAAFFKCQCEINNVRKCQTKAKLVSDNFVNIEKAGNVFTIATTLTSYEIIKSNKITITQQVPAAGIFSVLLNEQEKLKIGGVEIDGESDKPTFIAKLFPETFTVAPVPTIPQLPTRKPTQVNYFEIH